MALRGVNLLTATTIIAEIGDLQRFATAPRIENDACIPLVAGRDFDDNQFAELASLTRYSPVRDIVTNPVPVAIDVTRA